MSAKKSCSTRRTSAPAAATARCTRCWPRPSTSWACRTGRSWSARWAAGVFTYYYFDVGNVQAAHGRAPAVATAIKRSRPGSIVISYQGDGDLSAIGSAEILHAANRGENITVIFVNNAIYSMTGGQSAPTTLLGQKSTTTPDGRKPPTEGYPLHVSELLSTLEAPAYIERVGLGDNKQIAQAARAIRRGAGKPGARTGLLTHRSAFALPDHLEDDAGGGAALGARCDGEDLPAGRVLRPDERTAAAGATDGCGRAEPDAPPLDDTSAHSRRCRGGFARRQRRGACTRTRRSISKCALRALAGKACCCSAKCWPRPDSMPGLRFRGCRRMGRRCARARRTAMCGFRARPSIRRW